MAECAMVLFARFRAWSRLVEAVLLVKPQPVKLWLSRLGDFYYTSPGSVQDYTFTRSREHGIRSKISRQEERD
jgi:hypothetical protein